MTNVVEFRPFPKIARLSRDIVITEKVDGTNASIYIDEEGTFLTGCRTRWITPEDDNHGFSRWAHEHKDELLALGPGRHFGEWWGRGINRGYGLSEKRFSLFNVSRWIEFSQIGLVDGGQTTAPAGCYVVPVLYQGEFDTEVIRQKLEHLRNNGSHAAPGFKNPEGIVVFHTAANLCFKKTIDKDEQPKGKQ